MALKIKEIESMSNNELKSKLEELKKDLIKHNAQIATGTNPKSPGQVKVIKKTVARILTVLKIKGGEKKQ